MAADSADFVLVLEDLRDWDNADHLAGLSIHRAQCVSNSLPASHPWSVTAADATALDAFPSLDTPIAREILHLAFELGWRVYRDRSAAAVPAAVAKYAGRFVELAPKALAALTVRPMLLHGDIRADNMFFDGDSLKIVDFQMASRAAGATDIAYRSKACRLRCVAGTTRSWCASTLLGSVRAGSLIIRSTRRGGTTDLQSPISWCPRYPLVGWDASAGTLTRTLPEADRAGGGGDASWTQLRC